jgi:methionine sulfoxide reductase catalytic subunit
MLIKRPSDIRPSEITPFDVYQRRREFIGAAGALALGAAIGPSAEAAEPAASVNWKNVPKSKFSTSEKMNNLQDVAGYVNYYEFGTDKTDPPVHAKRLKVQPWTVAVEGEVAKPRTFGVEDLMKLGMEERIYRLRCVEAWSMVVPWIGFEFNKLAKLVEPTSKAKFVEFVTALQPENMPGVRLPVLEWPYIEGLRMDEAMNPLTILSMGMFGQALPNQNGAPVRLVVPWKYGFKSGKSIVKIRFVERQPKTAWEKANPQEYGFYSNVNPDVDHPRWSQKTEKRLPAFFANHKTQLFNGYGDQVASLYAGMDLRKFY